MGFQATAFGQGVNEVKRMIERKLRPSPADYKFAKEKNSGADSNCKIFLGYTSNMASCGVREVIRFLAQHKMVDCIVATAGGIEEDFIKVRVGELFGNKTGHKGAHTTNVHFILS